MFESILASPATNFPINPWYFLLALTEAFVVGYIVIRVYRYKHHFSTQGQSFQTSMLIMAPLIALILMFIGSNLALSIGMVGALSIVRFRTIVKDPLDLMYLFLLIGIGLGCGTYNFVMTLAGTLFILIGIFFIQTKTPSIKGGVLMIRNEDETNAVNFSNEFRSAISGAVQDRIDMNKSATEITILVDNEPENLHTVLQDLRKKYNISQVSYYSNKNEY